MERVYFDGTFESAGQVLAACERINKRVLVVLPRRHSAEDRAFMNDLRDCNGSLCHFENGRCVRHVAVGSGRHCTRPVADGVEAYFRILAERETSDDDKWEALERLKPCHGCTGMCAACTHVVAVGREFGFYDLWIEA